MTEILGSRCVSQKASAEPMMPPPTIAMSARMFKFLPFSARRRYIKPVLHLDRTELAVRLKRRALIDRLERAFAAENATPVRQRYDLGGGGAGKTLLLMPGWRANGAIGVKLV